jgi:transposase
VTAKRTAFRRWVRRQDPRRLVFLDEAGANLAMGRSHAWVKRGEEYVEPRPMNWGDNLTLVGAIRRRGWVVLNTKWKAMNKVSFIEWVRRRLAPRLRRGDIVVLDNLPAHKAPEVEFFIQQRGASIKRLPPYSHDFNPIEAAWSLVKRRIRDCAPRTGPALTGHRREKGFTYNVPHGDPVVPLISPRRRRVPPAARPLPRDPSSDTRAHRVPA